MLTHACSRGLQVELRMETASVLELRKVLDGSNPQHRRIIEQAAAAMGQEEDEDVPPPAAATHQTAAVKAEKGRRASNPNPNIMDLTVLAPAVKPELGAEGGDRVSISTCDLTGDENEPVWGAQERKRVKIE